VNGQQPHGLYHPSFEHDACGLGALVQLDGTATHGLVQQALTALANLEHRGATGADAGTGDGAGITTQMPDRLLRNACRRELGYELPAAGGYAAGLVFLPRDPALRLRCEELCIRICAEEGHRALGWRDPPVRPQGIGTIAAGSAPVIRQLIVERRNGDEAAFERKLYVIRRRVERAAMQAGVPEAEFTIVSLSARRLVYKGLLKATQLGEFYGDLTDDRYETALALVHSRFSTNTLGTWDLAHPFNLLAHNGEINTVRGNGNWLAAREPQLRSELFGDDLQKLFPIAEQRWSDSAKLDAMVELLVLAGRSLPHALAMLIPPAWTDGTLEMDDEVRAFFEYHASLVEPWDGPAALVATDGLRVVATLDRNGLRPARYVRTRDGLVVVASEVGVLRIDPAEVIESGRLRPGQMLVLEPGSGRIMHDREVKRGLAHRRPYRQWLLENRRSLREPDAPGTQISEPTPLLMLQRAFGYTSEELRRVIGPLARDGSEPVGSMGDDTPPAVLSDQGRLLPAYFRQQFAQVTNPPIDPQRETLVMSLRTAIGAIGNLLGERPDDCRRLVIESPIMRDEQLQQLRSRPHDGLAAITLSTLYRPASGARGLEQAVDDLLRAASRAVWDGIQVVILSDRGVDADHAAIPPLLAVAAVHSHLVREGARTMCGLVVESGEPRETMQFALLLGYGAAAVNPYLALAAVRQLHAEGELDAIGEREAEQRYLAGLEKGLLKICSKMGISTIQSYRGAQLFEAIGLGRQLIERYFPGTVSRLGGIELAELHDQTAERHRTAFAAGPIELAAGGEYQQRVGGERHAWDADAVALLQRAVRSRSHASFEQFARSVDAASRGITLRGGLELCDGRPAIPLDQVEPSSEIVKRFATGAMSLGSISKEAHETLALAMNALGGRSNTGEGGEDPGRSVRDADGGLRRSAIKQVASARFGVTAGYLVDADQLQIKISQGAKPGEGGQLPGDKVDATIAALRHSTPGVGLISPPPHHDIYSIEDLAQLIHDLKSVNPRAEISVKLVAEAGVGTVAAGVAKAKAEHIVIAGHDGGTGAAPLSSLKQTGLPWEMGIVEAHQVLVMNGLRGRVRLQVDGGLRTGRDVAIAAMLGAEEFAFSTAPLVAAGCVMMRVCHLNTCPVGIATQDPELRRRFTGTPDHVMRYFLFVAEQVRELMASLGVASIDELVARSDLLRASERADRLDLSPLLAPALGREGAARRRREPQQHGLEGAIDHGLIEAAEPALAGDRPVVIRRRVTNTDRSVGAMLAGEVVRRAGREGLAADSVTVLAEGIGGQSFGAFLPHGVTLQLTGWCNDYAGKGLSGGRLVVRPPGAPDGRVGPDVVVGNTVLYGATGGRAFFRGYAGERFCVRNSGATAVVEGVGDHACEYMTGGVVAVLGRTGRNFAAGMSGGIAFVLDADGGFRGRCNLAMVDVEPMADEDDVVALIRLLEEHQRLTDSPLAAELLAAQADIIERFQIVIPHDLRRTGVRPSAVPMRRVA
jgi:glutamate synthase (NADPH/NADH) large chain